MSSFSYTALSKGDPHEGSMKTQSSNSYTPLPRGPQSYDESKPVRKEIRKQDVVQFIESITIVRSDAGHVDVGIMRLGLCEGSCECTWRTEAGSAESGKQYVDASGTISMKDGENSSEVRVPILCDSHWNATKEFKIVLENPSNCTLGLFLKVVRVKVVDTHVFPSNAFKDQVNPMAEDINEFAVFADYLKLMLHQDGVKWRSGLTLVFTLLHNLYHYMALLLQVYVVDKLFNFNYDAEKLYIPGNRLLTAYFIGLLLFVPKVVFVALHHVENRMDLHGKMRAEMLKSLFRKYMNYSSQSRDEISLPDMVFAMAEDAVHVSHGFTNVLHMLRCVGRIAVALTFTVHKNPGSWWAIILVTCAMLVWAKLRTRAFIKASSAVCVFEADLLAFGNMALSNMSVIAAYAQRPQMNEYFAGKVNTLITQTIEANNVILSNKAFPELMGPTMVAVYILVDAPKVANHSLDLGTYLAMISVFGEICTSFTDVYAIFMNIASTFPSLAVLTKHLNMATDLPELEKVSNQTVERTEQILAEMPAEPREIPTADRMQLIVDNVSFAYDIGQGNMFKIFANLNFVVDQGKIVAISSHRSGLGRTTLLKLLAGTLHPTQGFVFIPSHLRKLLITRDIFILGLSIWQNITFGNKTGNNPYRVEKILEHFKLQVVLENEQFQNDLTLRKAEFDGKGAALDDEEHQKVHKTNVIMTYRESHRGLIHLVRGLVMNPEVMLIHRPFVHFHDEADIQGTEKALLGHVKNRGFLTPPEHLSFRRPRTVFMSLDTQGHQCDHMVDLIWKLPEKLGARPSIALTHRSGEPNIRSPVDEPRRREPRRESITSEGIYETGSREPINELRRRLPTNTLVEHNGAGKETHLAVSRTTCLIGKHAVLKTTPVVYHHSADEGQGSPRPYSAQAVTYARPALFE